jgi:hypothetical protein
MATPEDILQLADAAKIAKDAPSWLWTDVRRAMEEHSGLLKREATDMVLGWRIAADLGRFPAFNYPQGLPQCGIRGQCH